MQARKLMRTFKRSGRILLPNKIISVTVLATEFTWRYDGENPVGK